MNALLFGAAAALYLAAAILYYRGHFGLSGVAGAVFWGLMVVVVLGAMGPVGAAVTLAVLAVFPAGFLLLHVVDARRGIFLLPTIYSIPTAFFCGLVLWITTGLAMLL